MARKRKIISIAFYDESLADQELLHQLALVMESTGKNVNTLIKECLRKELGLYHTELELKLLSENKRLQEELDKEQFKKIIETPFIEPLSEEEIFRDMLNGITE